MHKTPATKLSLGKTSDCTCDDISYCGPCGGNDRRGLYDLERIVHMRALLQNAISPLGFIEYASNLCFYFKARSLDKAITNHSHLFALWSLERPDFLPRLRAAAHEDAYPEAANE